MAKAEEIRKGMSWILAEIYELGKANSTINYRSFTRRIQEFEDSQGVVIKVDRELPDCDFCHGEGKAVFPATTHGGIYLDTCLKCRGTGKDYAGYVALGPLI